MDDQLTLDRIVAHLATLKRVAIFTHQRPDCDALGSQAALAIVLRRHGAHPIIVNFSPVPPQYASLQQNLSGIEIVELSPAVEATLEAETDGIVCVDTCTYGQMEPAIALLKKKRDQVIAFDHHRNRDPIGPHLFTDMSAAACVEIIARVAHVMRITIDDALARPLLAGLVTDTGWFRFDNVTAKTLRLAADLADAGVKPADLYETLMQTETPPKLALTERALRSLEWLADYRIGCMSISAADFAQTGASQSQTEYLIDAPLQVKTTEVAALITEMPDGRVRASLRSKHDVDVSKICGLFGGGGHSKAAGCRLDGPMADAKKRLMDAVTAALPK